MVPGLASSTIVLTTEEALASAAMFSKLLSVIVPSVIVKFSLPSANTSSNVSIVNVAELLPAGIVTVVTPVKSVPSTAVPEYVNSTVIALVTSLAG